MFLLSKTANGDMKPAHHGKQQRGATKYCKYARPTVVKAGFVDAQARRDTPTRYRSEHVQLRAGGRSRDTTYVSNVKTVVGRGYRLMAPRQISFYHSEIQEACGDRNANGVNTKTYNDHRGKRRLRGGSPDRNSGHMRCAARCKL